MRCWALICICRGMLPLFTLKIYTVHRSTWPFRWDFPQKLMDMAFQCDFNGYLDARPVILISITCPLTRSARPYFASKSSDSLVPQTVVCHRPSGKFPHFLVKFMKAAVCLSPPGNLYDPILLWGSVHSVGLPTARLTVGEDCRIKSFDSLLDDVGGCITIPHTKNSSI